jgi:hypothetical protein
MLDRHGSAKSELAMKYSVADHLAESRLGKVRYLDLTAVWQVERCYVPSSPCQVDEPVESKEKRSTETLHDRCFTTGGSAMLVDDPWRAIGWAAEQHLPCAEEPILIVENTETAEHLEIRKARQLAHLVG